MIDARTSRIVRIAVGAAVAAVISGCSTGAPVDEPVDDAIAAPSEPQGASSLVTETINGPYSVQSSDGSKLLSLAESSDVGFDARREGALQLTDDGCFAIDRLVFVSARPITLLDDHRLLLDGQEYAIGERVASGGGSLIGEAHEALETALHEECGETTAWQLSSLERME